MKDNDTSARPAKTAWSTTSRRDFLRNSLALGVAAATSPPLAHATTEVWEEGDLQCRPPVTVATPAYPLDLPLLRDFIRLSEALTGVAPLDKHLASEYLERFATHPDLTSLLPQLIQAYREIAPGETKVVKAEIDRRLFQDAALRPAAEQIIYLWYVSAFFLPRSDDPKTKIWVYGSPEHYERGLLWNVIRAHAPMTRGGPYGYWADAPSV